MREWMSSDPRLNTRDSLFLGTKIGPGGACWPLGYNESIAQAKTILGYYNQLPSSAPSPNITKLDLLMIHWPINCGPCAIGGRIPSATPDGHCPTTIPTTDPFCDSALPTYGERACRISTWRGMLAVFKMGLTRAIGVSNFNSTMMQDLKDAGLPLPAANQVELNPGIAPKPFTPYGQGTETIDSLIAWSAKNGVLVNGWSPFGGTGAVLSAPAVKAVAAAHKVSAAQAVLRWNVQQGFPVIPKATNPAYQAENLDIFGFELSAKEMVCMATLDPASCPPPPPPPPPTPAQVKCEFVLGDATMRLKALPQGPFTLKDGLNDPYVVTSPCGSIWAQNTAAPAVEDCGSSCGGAQIPLGFLSALTVSPLPPQLRAKGGMRLTLGAGDAMPGCAASGTRVLRYDMVCAAGLPPSAPPNVTMRIPTVPANPIDPIPHCYYQVEWHTPLACTAPSPPSPPPSCVYSLGGARPYSFNLSALPPDVFTLTDEFGDKYDVVSPCRHVDGTVAPAVERAKAGVNPAIPLGYMGPTLQALQAPGVQGLRLMLTSSTPTYHCGNPRQVWYDMICDKTADPSSRPNATMLIDNLPPCVYNVQWRTPHACNTAPAPVYTPPLPSPQQIAMMDTGLAQFMHFSVDTWSGIEHNCVPVGSSACLPTSLFAPTNLSTDQWVEAAVAMGASEICLTAHHEGGFCLWDTKYSNYRPAQPPCLLLIPPGSPHGILVEWRQAPNQDHRMVLLALAA